MSNFHIVVDMGYGDAGKGVFVNKLAAELPRTLVIRHNGGHQAGHTVTLPCGFSHVFSTFGAGTLQRVPTFISKYCTLEPASLNEEHKSLTENGYKPVLFVDNLAMITTPYDILINKLHEMNHNNGSVGVGFGATIERNSGPCKLYAQDLQWPQIVRKKLSAIKQYTYTRCIGFGSLLPDYIDLINEELFIDNCNSAFNKIEVVNEIEMFEGEFDNYIFEGAQGVLLDMDFGIFPNVTRSNTTSKNAFEILKRNGFSNILGDVYYLTRSYLTRHGNGWNPSEKFPVQLINNEYETNVYGPFQKEFRTGLFNLDMFIYACQCESNFSRKQRNHLVVSCMDQIEEFELVSNGEVLTAASGSGFITHIVDTVHNSLGDDYFDGNIYLNYSPSSITYITIQTLEMIQVQQYDHMLATTQMEAAAEHEYGLAMAELDARRDEPEEENPQDFQW